MGIDTKGLVATNCKDVFFVMNKIERAINKLIAPHLILEKMRFCDETKDGKYKKVRLEIRADSELVQVHFTFNGEKRTLWVFFGCDSSEQSQSINLSMGCWGESDLLMMTALRAVSMLGTTYFDHNDCDEVDPAPLEVPPLTYIQACLEKLEHPNIISLGHWYSMSKKGLLRDGPVSEVLGLPETSVKRILAGDYESASKELESIIDLAKPKEEVVA